jgi:hypothetical protein
MNFRRKLSALVLKEVFIKESDDDSNAEGVRRVKEEKYM